MRESWAVRQSEWVYKIALTLVVISSPLAIPSISWVDTVILIAGGIAFTLFHRWGAERIGRMPLGSLSPKGAGGVFLSLYLAYVVSLVGGLNERILFGVWALLLILLVARLVGVSSRGGYRPTSLDIAIFLASLIIICFAAFLRMRNPNFAVGFLVLRVASYPIMYFSAMGVGEHKAFARRFVALVGFISILVAVGGTIRIGQALIHYSSGNRYYEMEKWKEADEEYQKVLKLNDSLQIDKFLPGLYRRMGYIALRRGNYDRAIEIFLGNLRLRSRDKLANYDLAYAYESKGDTASAEKYYLRALRIDGRYREALSRLVGMYIEVEHWHKAVRFYEKYPDAFLEIGRDWNDDVRFKIALTFEGAGLWNEAIEMHNGLAEKGGGIYYHIGVCYAQLGDGRGARRSLEEAFERGFDTAFGHYIVGLALVKEGKDDEAEEHLRLAISRDPRLIDAYFRLGENPPADLKPSFAANHKFEGGLVFEGYDILDVEQFKRGGQFPILLYWRGAGSSGGGPERIRAYDWGGLFRVSDRIYEMRMVTNLAPNPSFEMNTPGARFPDGWESDIYKSNLANHRIAREGESGNVAVLDNVKDASTNYQTDSIPIDEGSYYLQGGTIRSEGGNGYIGRIWIPSYKYNYAVSGFNSPAWHNLVQVIRPLPGSRGARLWLINYKSNGKVYFDDMLFAKLDIPKIEKGADP
ncbi:MAG: tetratricopeptide repeat protein [bacterium]